MRHVLVALLLATACATNGPSDTGGETAGLSLFPDTMLYSGAESGTGAKVYTVTIAAKGASGVVWKSDDPSIATVTGTDALGTVKALKPGSTTISATAGGMTVRVPLTVNAYNAGDRMAGATEWTKSCASCHEGTGPDVSPSDIGKHTDAEVLAAVTSGKNPEGGNVSIGAAAHSFPIAQGTPAYAGIVAYMRSLTPGTPVQDN